MRTIWNGSINFGLVNIPIGLAVAQQRKDTSFRTLHRECGTPIKQKRYCPFHERDVEADELVKGWEFAKGQFVMVEESDLEAVALQRSQSDRHPALRPDRASRSRSTSTAPTTWRPPTPRRSGARTSSSSAPCRTRRWPRSGSSCSGARRTSASSGRSATRSRSRRSTTPRTCAPAREIDAAVGDRRQGARARHGQAARREPRRGLRPRGVRERVPERAPRDAGGQARGQGDRAAGAGQEAPVVDLMEALKKSVAQARKDKPSAAKPKAKKARRGSAPPKAPRTAATPYDLDAARARNSYGLRLGARSPCGCRGRGRRMGCDASS